MAGGESVQITLEDDPTPLPAESRIRGVVARTKGDAVHEFLGTKLPERLARETGGYELTSWLDWLMKHGEIDSDGLSRATARARAAAEQMRRQGTPVRLLHSIFIREDEICFLLFDARSGEAVAETARRAAIAFERVVEIEIGLDES